MSDQPSPSTASLETQIHALARAVREGRRLDPEARQALADLVDELSRTLQTAPHTAEEMARVAESAAHLAQALEHPREERVLTAARVRLEQAVARADTKAPVLSGVAQRLLDILANLGI